MSRWKNHFVLTLVAVVIGASACSPLLSAPEGHVATSSPSPLETVDGMAECTEAALSDTAEGVISPDERVGSIANFGCADGWAYARVTVEPSSEVAASPGASFPIMMIFEAKGQFWIPKDPMDVCGTPPSVTSPLVAPPDSQVPSSLWSAACWTT